jgi:XTP/dITP diphosphohydrolase
MNVVLIATHNMHKVYEIKEILHDLPIDVISLDEYGLPVPDVTEDGLTFSENASKKAFHIAQKTGYYTLSDDSGLCVDYLNGKPGVLSARYAGISKNDALNRERILTDLIDVPDNKRQAYFMCAIAFASPKKIITVVEGRVDGVIGHSEKGTNGFGYDSIFIYPPMNSTFAQLESDKKNLISHRYKALMKFKKFIESYSFENK